MPQSSSSYQVCRFKPQYRSAFAELNREWIELNFKLEKPDLIQLENPEEHILKPGGEIFFVIENDIPVGTCAMVVHGVDSYELVKMGVSPKCRGKGYGDILIEASIQWAREKNAKRVVLESNTKLVPAIALYRKHGFKEIAGHTSEYSRCNITMELLLSD